MAVTLICWHDQKTGSEWDCFIPLPVLLHISHSMTNREWVTLLFQVAISSIMSHPMTNSMWVTLLYLCFSRQPLILSHPITNRECVTLLYFFAKQSHQPCSSHDQQEVSGAALFLCQALQTCLIPWPTVCEWYSLTDSLINHTSSHNQQDVSDSDCFISLPSLINHVTS